MDISKGLYVCVKKMDVFYALMDKPTRALVPTHCKGVNDRLGPEFQLRSPKAKIFLNSKSDKKNIAENMLDKNILLRKCHVRFILHFALAAEDYICVRE